MGFIKIIVNIWSYFVYGFYLTLKVEIDVLCIFCITVSLPHTYTQMVDFTLAVMSPDCRQLDSNHAVIAVRTDSSESRGGFS